MRVRRRSALSVRRSRHGSLQHWRFGTRGIGGYSLRSLRGGDDRWLCRRNWRRDEHDSQIRYFDPSISPREGEARKPQFLATEPEAQQKCVNHQGEQERDRQRPVLTALAPDPPLPTTCAARTSRRCRLSEKSPFSPAKLALGRILISPALLRASQVLVG